jgi:glycosyltransferase involved in cell wall biosynthesis
MRISTIMAVYNAERYVSQALDSVLAQTVPSDEIIAIDDGSTDGTPDVLRNFATRVRIIHQQNCGVACALNVAITESTGDTLAFLDCDDLWLPDKLQIQSAVLLNEKDLEAVFGFVQQFVSPDLNLEVAREYIVPESPQPGISKNSLLIRRHAFERIGRFNEELTASDFVEWYARAIVLGLRWRMLPELVALRRHHPNNAGRRLRSKQHDEILQALKRSLDMRRRRQTSQ